ncbi:MAG: class I SAM-dependent methyltransferase [Candidatus Algichlamydia australiensis]|nr:class I SAM-dependent methyltransferase [Chlamydiales bacterium]
MESNTCTLEFTKDLDGKELLLKDGKFQVMMEWEKPYMKACVDALTPSGKVLEIGFGCGYSAAQFQSYPLDSHTIIEYHPTVVAHAKKWAENRANVNLIHDTWQNALKNLGTFDVIFFDDYPLESEKEVKEQQKAKKRAIPILSKGKKLLSSVNAQFSEMQSKRYSDEDLDFFFTKMSKSRLINPNHFLKFFSDLHKRGQITSDQQAQVLDRLLKQELITQEAVKEFEEKNRTEACPFRNSHDRFLSFLKIVLDNHTHKGSKISCFLEDPTSKYEDPKFTKTIIENPHLDYKEKLIPITPSPHCSYYQAKEALVITITRLD